MRVTRCKPNPLAAVVVCGFVILGAQSRGESAKPDAKANARQEIRRGPELLWTNKIRDPAAFLAGITNACPTVGYRLPGFAMKCNECHVPQTSKPELSEDQARRLAQMCAANLKYVGLAARTWASNHNTHLPGAFALMARELRTPLVAACPELIEEARAQQNKYQFLPEALWEMETNRLEMPTWFDLNRKGASYQIVLPRAWRSNPTATYVRCRIHGTELHADGSVIPGLPILSRVPPANRRTSIPRIARIAQIQIGFSTQEALAKRWGEGLTVTGGHPNSGRVWRVRDTSWVVRTDGFEYSDRGLVVDSFEISSEASPPRDAPFARLNQKHFAWLGEITPGLPRERLVKILNRERLPTWPTERGFEVHADGFLHLKGLDLQAWAAGFEFEEDKLSRLKISAVERR